MKTRGFLVKACVYLDGAKSWLGYSVYGFPANKADMKADGYGWSSSAPAMVDAWARYESDPSFHNRKNLGSEWCRLSAERAYKLGAFIGCCLATALLLIGLIAGCCLGVALAYHFFGGW
jgi:hypothetical protein